MQTRSCSAGSKPNVRLLSKTRKWDHNTHTYTLLSCNEGCNISGNTLHVVFSNGFKQQGQGRHTHTHTNILYVHTNTYKHTEWSWESGTSYFYSQRSGIKAAWGERSLFLFHFKCEQQQQSEEHRLCVVFMEQRQKEIRTVRFHVVGAACEFHNSLKWMDGNIAESSSAPKQHMWAAYSQTYKSVSILVCEDAVIHSHPWGFCVHITATGSRFIHTRFILKVLQHLFII